MQKKITNQQILLSNKSLFSCLFYFISWFLSYTMVPSSWLVKPAAIVLAYVVS